MKIAFIGDQYGKVQHNRYLEFVKHIKNHSFVFIEANDKNLQKKCNKCDAAYYASATLYLKYRVNHKRLFGSFTSWKCVNDKESSKIWNYTDAFNGLSVNNLGLFEMVNSKCNKLAYIPNGVDTEFYFPKHTDLDKPIVLGWVGNIDRKEKNYDAIFLPLSKKLTNYKFVSVATKKASKNILTSEQMIKFYHSIHFLLVTSSFEGTPNPALEAASCGVPIISTKVGNMPDLIMQGSNGYLVECTTVDSFKEMLLNEIENLHKNRYIEMRKNARKTIETSWAWSTSCQSFAKFFGDE